MSQSSINVLEKTQKKLHQLCFGPSDFSNLNNPDLSIQSLQSNRKALDVEDRKHWGWCIFQRSYEGELWSSHNKATSDLAPSHLIRVSDTNRYNGLPGSHWLLIEASLRLQSRLIRFYEFTDRCHNLQFLRLKKRTHNTNFKGFHLLSLCPLDLLVTF